VGYLAGINNTTGSNNTALGVGAGPTTGNLTNATAIGASASVSESNALVLGGTGANAVSVGIGTTAPKSALDVLGTLKLEGSGNGVVFPDGTKQTTAGPAKTVAACNSFTGGGQGCNLGCSGKLIQYILVQDAGQCTVTSDTGSCSGYSNSQPPGYYGSCCVCAPN